MTNWALCAKHPDGPHPKVIGSCFTQCLVGALPELSRHPSPHSLCHLACCARITRKCCAFEAVQCWMPWWEPAELWVAPEPRGSQCHLAQVVM